VSAFSTTGYGADVASGSFDADVQASTSPVGPSPVFGPQVRGFEALGTPVPKVSFYAYGTLKNGVNVAWRRRRRRPLEIATGADLARSSARTCAVSTSTAPPGDAAGFSFYAYQTLKYGANLALAASTRSRERTC